MHRAVVNNKVTRISVVVAHGPSLDTIVKPASPLMEKENSPSANYIPMKYKDYLEMQQSSRIYGKSCLEKVKIQRSWVFLCIFSSCFQVFDDIKVLWNFNNIYEYYSCTCNLLISERFSRVCLYVYLQIKCHFRIRGWC